MLAATALERIRTDWRQLLDARYPDGYRGVEVEGVELVLLDAEIAALMQDFLGAGGALSLDATARLGLACRDAALVTRALNGEARTYFAQHEALARRALEHLRARVAI